MGAAARNTFTGTITVTVKELLPNGNLGVVGEKQIAINRGTEFIRFSGVVNPRTISGSNTVPSTRGGRAHRVRRQRLHQRSAEHGLAATPVPELSPF